MSLIQRVRRAGLESGDGGARSIDTVDDFALAMGSYYGAGGVMGGGYGYSTAAASAFPGGVQQTLAGESFAPIGGDFVALAQNAHARNGVVFACMLVRQLVFSAIRFRYQRLTDGKPSDSFGSSSLGILERPWAGGTTQDLLNRILQDADLAGNSFFIQTDGELIRLRPDWVDIVVEPREFRGGILSGRKLGYVYTQGGRQSGEEPIPFMSREVAHFMPVPDPQASFRGMSWLTPVIREIENDRLMETHKRKFFENGATPNMIVKHNAQADIEKVRRFARMLEEDSAGIANAYKTLHLYPGADATVVGSDFRQNDFKAVQGGGETRIAAAAGVPPVIVGLSEGLQAATYSNYSQARRRFGDGTMHPLWQNVSGSLEPLVGIPPGGANGGVTPARLWYDASGVPFLREDEADAAKIAETKARTVRTYVDGGYTPESAVAAVEAGDLRLLVHTGLFSVQLQQAGTTAPDPAADPAADPNNPPAADPAVDPNAAPQDNPAPQPNGAGQ